MVKVEGGGGVGVERGKGGRLGWKRQKEKVEEAGSWRRRGEKVSEKIRREIKSRIRAD